MFVLRSAAAKHFGDEVVFGKEANGFSDVVGGVVGDGVSRRALVAGGDETIEGERVEVRGGDLLFEQASEDACGWGGELEFGKVLHGQIFVGKSLNDDGPKDHEVFSWEGRLLAPLLSVLRSFGNAGGDMGAVEVGALLDHVVGLLGGLCGEPGDEGGFGEIFPILLGHLGQHRFELEAGGVEDAGIVGALVVFEVESRVLFAGDFGHGVAIEAEQPVGLIEPVFANEGRGLGGEESRLSVPLLAQEASYLAASARMESFLWSFKT